MMNRVPRYVAACLVMGLALAGTTLSAAPAKSKGPSLVGTLQKIDGQTLTVETKKGPETVMLSPTAQIHHGSKTLAAADLSSQTGSRVKVRYRTVNGQKEAQSVTVSSSTKVASTSSTSGTKASTKTAKTKS
jgi:hypothetical protein